MAESDIERHSANARDMMNSLKVPPRPSHYHVFFEHAAGTNTSLSQILNIYLTNRKHIDQSTLEELFETYVAPNIRDMSVTSAEDLDQLISQTMAVIQTTENNAQELAGEVSQVANDLGHAGAGVAGIATAVERLAGAARRAVARAQAAEVELRSNRSETVKIKARFEAANKAALTDGLTNIPNRKNLDQTLRRMAAESMETGQPLSIAMVDIDHFKKFNDTYGHQLGDNVIKLVARKLREQSREADFAARYGGEEFTLVMANTESAIAADVAERVRLSLANKTMKRRDNGEPIGSVTISCGVATYKFGETLDALIDRADKALYQAKQSGRNRVVLAQ